MDSLDYFDFFWIDPQHLGVVVADVSGKGVSASLYMSMLRTALRSMAPKYKNPKQVLVKTHQLLSQDLKKGQFVTVFYLILNIVDKKITYASAGHNPLILYCAEEKKFHFLNPKGIPLGLVLPAELNFEQKLDTESLSLRPEDWLFLYTDGITEAMNAQKQPFGKERFLEFIQQNIQLSAQKFTKTLWQTLINFTEGVPQSDDITLVVIKDRELAQKELPVTRETDSKLKSQKEKL